jgi:hypothetical protein
METTVWVPAVAVLGAAVVGAGPAYIAFLLKKVHHQVNGQEETLSTMVFETSRAVGRIEEKVDKHLSDHAGDGK